MVVSTEQSQWFKEEVHPHEPALRAWLHRRYPSLSDVDDVVQESYLRLLWARQQGPISSAKAYLYAIARNAALGIFRKRKLISPESVDNLEGSCISNGAGDVVEIVSSHQEFALALDAIEGLPPRCREIVVLRAVNGLSHREIAQKLGLSEQTVRVQVARGMKKCAEFLRQRGVHGRTSP
jgi:RNA polymerase sigma-70 factor (ECF subfamily)